MGGRIVSIYLRTGSLKIYWRASDTVSKIVLPVSSFEDVVFGVAIDRLVQALFVLVLLILDDYDKPIEGLFPDMQLFLNTWNICPIAV